MIDADFTTYRLLTLQQRLRRTIDPVLRKELRRQVDMLLAELAAERGAVPAAVLHDAQSRRRRSKP